MSKFAIFNGSRKGLFKFMANQVKKEYVILIDIPEEELWNMRNKFPGTQAYYLYNNEDLKDKTIHDIGPILNLYNSFINISDKN